jgi:hypothetical protein
MISRVTCIARAKNRTLLVFALVVSLVISLAASFAFFRNSPTASIFQLSNLVGPTAHSLLVGRGFEATSEGMGTEGNPIVFRAARMPMAAITVAGLAAVFGDRIATIAMFKCILFLIPIWIAMGIILCSAHEHDPRRSLVLLLLILPFAVTAFLADVVNLQVEEGYSYSLFGLAFSIIVFYRFWLDGPKTRTITRISVSVLFALAVSGLYLAKSSMILVALVLGYGFYAVSRNNVDRAIVILIIGIAPVLWAIHQHEVSGRYSVGTSLDGINFRKGNNARFLERYPPAPGTNLDQFDNELSAGFVFSNEWQFNDFQMERGIRYVKDNPEQALRADLVKLRVIFLSTEKYGSAPERGLRKLVDTGGMVVFRLTLFAALAYAIVASIFQTGDARLVGGLFLVLVFACVFPYVLGFAYTRHFIVLLFPAVTLLCRALLRSGVADKGV